MYQKFVIVVDLDPVQQDMNSVLSGTNIFMFSLVGQEIILDTYLDKTQKLRDGEYFVKAQLACRNFIYALVTDSKN